MSTILIVLATTCLLVWIPIAGARWGRLLAVPIVSVAASVGFLLLLAVTPVFRVHIGLATVVAAIAASAVGIVVLVRNPAMRARPSLHALALWIPALLGAVVWAAARVLSQFLPGAAYLSWTMEGDSTNTLGFARRIIADHGVLFGSGENPVPLPAAVLAVPLSLERLLPGGDALGSDIAVFGWSWLVVLAIGCVAMGAVAASVIGPSRPRLVAVASAMGSLLPLTWLVGGLPIDFGFFNVPFVIPVALACWLLFIGSGRAPVAAVVALVGASTLLLVTWSPLILVPVFLGVVVVVRERRRFLALRRWELAVPLASVAVVLVYAAFLTIPTYFVQSSAFQAPSIGYPSTWYVIAPTIVVALFAAVYLRTRSSLPVFPGIVALIAAGYLGTALMLFVVRDLYDPWTAYYPVKMAWTVCVILLPVALSLALGCLARIRPRAVAVAAVTVTAAGTVAVAAFAPLGLPVGYEARQPVDRMLGGHVWVDGDESVKIILALAERDEVGIVWQTDNPDEGFVNFWAMDAAGGALDEDPVLRRFAFRDYAGFRQYGEHRPDAANSLCALLRDPDISAVVYTDDAELGPTVDDWCAGGSARFVVGATPGTSTAAAP